MKVAERVTKAIIGLLMCSAPIILRLTKFQEDIGVMDAEFWGVATMIGMFFGTLTIWSGLSGQRVFEEVD